VTHISEDKKKIEIDLTDDDHEWFERIGKTAYEKCSELNLHRLDRNIFVIRGILKRIVKVRIRARYTDYVLAYRTCYYFN
jgi:hypothetical protein